MTTPTPISNPSPGSRAGAASDPLAALPDAATLARIANEFFSALPGSAEKGALLTPFAASSPAPALAPGGGIPSAVPGPSANPQEHAGLAAHASSLAPHAAAANSLPDTASTAIPALDGRVGGPSLGVPQTYAAALPLVSVPISAAASAPEGVPGPSTPYYFLGEASGYPSGLQPQSRLGTPSDDRVTAQPFALPGAAELRALIE
ncbi:MAG: hypothetical protein C5B46_02005, partial [Proteobacteria bacterium]